MNVAFTCPRRGQVRISDLTDLIAFISSKSRATFEKAKGRDNFVSEYSDKGPLAARLWLTGLVFCQIFLTPMAAFSITYLVEFEMASENFTTTTRTQRLCLGPLLSNL